MSPTTYNMQLLAMNLQEGEFLQTHFLVIVVKWPWSLLPNIHWRKVITDLAVVEDFGLFSFNPLKGLLMRWQSTSIISRSRSATGICLQMQYPMKLTPNFLHNLFSKIQSGADYVRGSRIGYGDFLWPMWFCVDWEGAQGIIVVWQQVFPSC